MGGIILLFIELTHPGFGAPGILGIFCFAVLFVVKYSLNYAGMFEVSLFVGGAALLLVEIFITPGFGIIGAAGIGLIFASLVLAFQQFTWPQSPSEFGAFQLNVFKVLASFTGAAIGIIVLARYLPSVPMLKRIIHTQDLSAARVGLKEAESGPALESMIGRVGVALTTLRPAGRAEFGEMLFDVVTEGDFIAKGARIEVESVHGNRVVVKPYREA